MTRKTKEELEQIIIDRVDDDRIDTSTLSESSVLIVEKRKATNRINEAYQMSLDFILREYPYAEQMTWEKQENEARAFLEDNTTPTPILDKIAQHRNLDKTELVNRVIAKSDAWIGFVGDATGKRQHLIDTIESATTVQEVLAVSWHD